MRESHRTDREAKMETLKVTFHLDGEGVEYRPERPIHLDSLLGFFVAMDAGLQKPTQSQKPAELDLPFGQEEINGHMVWQASALLPEGPHVEVIQYRRKRTRQHRAHLWRGQLNPQLGATKAQNAPMP